MKVLFTNDDGIDSAGLNALLTNLPEGIQAMVAAPAGERSAFSHSISLGKKIRVEELERNGIPYFKVHGTPVDCVKFAVSELDGFRPDLLVSGINEGANTGVSVYYSGTISAAREGSINQIPSMAISLCSKSSKDFRASVNIANRLIEGYRTKSFPMRVTLNVNVPALPAEQIKGLKITKQAQSQFVEEFIREEGEDGEKIYSLTGEIKLFEEDGTSDEEAVRSGFISLTPLKLDMTDYPTLSLFQEWLKRQ